MPIDQPVRLLWINPVTIFSYDRPMADYIDSIRSATTSVDIVSLKIGDINITNLEFRTLESAVELAIMQVTRWAIAQGFDGVCIGCFYDPGLETAREIAGAKMVVTAPCQSALAICSRLANRFSVIIGRDQWKDQMTDRITHYGYDRDLASFRQLGLSVDEMQKDPAHTADLIIEQAAAAITDDEAEIILLGCTVEFGFFQKVQNEVGIPVIDAIVACFKECEHAAKLKKAFGWSTSHVWGMQGPLDAEITSSHIFDGPPPIGNRIHVGPQ
jgi:allantoin racemase